MNICEVCGRKIMPLNVERSVIGQSSPPQVIEGWIHLIILGLDEPFHEPVPMRNVLVVEDERLQHALDT